MVVATHNEESQVAGVIETMPDFVDTVVEIDDASMDDTSRMVNDYPQESEDLFRIEFETNQGGRGGPVHVVCHAF